MFLPKRRKLGAGKPRGVQQAELNAGIEAEGDLNTDGSPRKMPFMPSIEVPHNRIELQGCREWEPGKSHTESAIPVSHGEHFHAG